MRSIVAVVFVAIVFIQSACSQTPVFTSVCSSGNQVFAGVKIVREGWETESYILCVVPGRQESGRLMLPQEISNREVIELFSAGRNILIVMSQRTHEQGDNPQFHSYNRKTKWWKKIAETDCVSYHKVKVGKNTLVFYYAADSMQAKEVELTKSVVFKGVHFNHRGEFSVPRTCVKDGLVEAELLGEDYGWNRLRVSLGNEVHLFAP